MQYRKKITEFFHHYRRQTGLLMAILGTSVVILSLLVHKERQLFKNTTISHLAPKSQPKQTPSVTSTLTQQITSPTSQPDTTPTATPNAALLPVVAAIPELGGFTVKGNTIYRGTLPHIFRGLDRPSLEWNPRGEGLSLEDYQKMKSWNANLVRLPLNQTFWREDTEGYRNRIKENVGWIEQAGMDVLLDLHWSDQGQQSIAAQQKMPDSYSLIFWQDLAKEYKNDSHVLFELYNEPHDVDCNTWKNGGEIDGWQAVGMQQLYDTIRTTGANNLIVIGGLNWAFDLRCVITHRIAGFNIVYATHPYNVYGKATQADWEEHIGFLSATDPILLTEFGDTTNTSLAGSDCTGDYDRSLLTWAESRKLSWTAWAWFPGDCPFPPLIRNWNADPNAPGLVVQEFLKKNLP